MPPNPLRRAFFEKMRTDAEFAYVAYHLRARVRSERAIFDPHVDAAIDVLAEKLSERPGYAPASIAGWLRFSFSEPGFRAQIAWTAFSANVRGKMALVRIVFDRLRRREPVSHLEIDTALTSLGNLVFVVGLPFLLWFGAVEIATERRVFLLAFGLGTLLMVNVARMGPEPSPLFLAQVNMWLVGKPRIVRFLFEVRYSPILFVLGAEAMSSFAKGLIVAAIGSFWSRAFDTLEIVLASAAVCIIVWEIGAYLFRWKR